jgi:copper chaperone CopZ
MDAIAFQESITNELDIIKNRVRNLIGDRHWGEEGRYKEVVLKNILRKHLPKNISIGTGFIIDIEQDTISKQLDIIIYDNTYPLLFSEGDFIITTLKNVKGIIEVKSSIGTGNNTFSSVVRQFDESIESIVFPTNKKIFLGIFSFDFNGNINSENIKNAIINSRKKINHISLGKNYFFRKWKSIDAHRLNPPITDCNNDFYNIYNINNLSFSYFISNLIDIVCNGVSDRYRFAFPIEGSKEISRIKCICI